MNLKRSHIEKAVQIRDFLHKNFFENYDYEFLCKKFGLNKFQLKSAFKAVTNDNIHSYLTKLKMDHAKRLLQKTEFSIDYISAAIGLDRSNFYIQFKKHEGKTPAQWRKDLTMECNLNDSHESSDQLKKIKKQTTKNVERSK
ncbi:helix-turn-helix domain-containing protein [Niastella populi]|uniref:HTH araC/xylS-type domain-containing protein n=1 Tax=Niastella populi TaxID=550983 RepID=A0A1V9G7S8_9BACT|nr:AraC family transcriptional regulator [Niastella populi]OQP66627.1 hypothetical protein A4R26_12640 [Niastella populi]